MDHITDTCTDACTGHRPSGYPCRCSCHYPTKEHTMDTFKPHTAASFTRPSDGTPLYGDLMQYGASERPGYPCHICSDANGMVLVRPRDLAEHHAGHVAGYAAYLAEQDAGPVERVMAIEQQTAADREHEIRDTIQTVLHEQLGDTLSPRRIDRVAQRLAERLGL